MPLFLRKNGGAAGLLHRVDCRVEGGTHIQFAIVGFLAQSRLLTQVEANSFQ